VAFNPVGQVVGQLNEVQPVREVIQQFVEEYVDAVERLESLQPE
jgi:NAD(P)H-dependent flavin oxidoreductase YrpB (nitropropane dioxygenase family)